MIKGILNRIKNGKSNLQYKIMGKIYNGKNKYMRGYSGLLYGNCISISGNCLGVYGNCSGITLNLDRIRISFLERIIGIDIQQIQNEKLIRRI